MQFKLNSEKPVNPDILTALLVSKPSSRYDESVERHNNMVRAFMTMIALDVIVAINKYTSRQYIENMVAGMTNKELFTALTNKPCDFL
jgi:hypothetical protein